MKASTVFIHNRHPRAALQAAHADFYAIQTGRYADVALQDEVTGDLAMNKAKWFFNVTRGTLIHINVLGRFSNLQSAIGAISATGGYRKGR
jgi:hypothetical protein